MDEEYKDRICEVKQYVKAHEDFPKKGILFRDLLPVFRDPVAFNTMLSVLSDYIARHYQQVQCIVGLEARGFLIGPPLALKLNCAFVPVRKAGKLPGATAKMSYSLEYGQDTVEIQKDAIGKGQKVIIVDDLIATGGTMKAGCDLVSQVGGNVICSIAVLELVALNGRAKLDCPFESMIKY